MMNSLPRLCTTSTRNTCAARSHVRRRSTSAAPRVLQLRVDDVDARGAGARQDEPRERVRDRRRERRERAGGRIEEEDVAGPDLDGQRPAVEAALERLDLQRHAVVVDTVTAADARPAVQRDQLNPIRGAKLFVSRCRSPVTNGRTIGLSSSTRLMLLTSVSILYRTPRFSVRSRMHAPVVLHEAGQMDVVGIGNPILIRLAASQCHREQQVVVVDAPVAVAIERREISTSSIAAVAEHAQVERRVHALHLPAHRPLVRAAHERERVGNLPAPLHRALRHAERRAGLETRKRELTPGSTGAIALSKSLKLTLNVFTARGESTPSTSPTACRRLGSWTRILSPRAVNALSLSYSDFDNRSFRSNPAFS